jgi:hypothetical protein
MGKTSGSPVFYQVWQKEMLPEFSVSDHLSFKR